MKVSLKRAVGWCEAVFAQLKLAPEFWIEAGEPGSRF
jgi:hypothetical protein